MDEGDRIYGFRARWSTAIGRVGEDDAKAMVGRREVDRRRLGRRREKVRLARAGAGLDLGSWGKWSEKGKVGKVRRRRRVDEREATV